MPQNLVDNVRNNMYVASEAIRLMEKAKAPAFTVEDASALEAFKKQMDRATKFIPTWVKVAVAIALGLGTMVGWKRIVVTVGEKIGKSHLTYGQGRIGRGRRDADDRDGRRVRAAGVDDARARVGRGRHDDGQRRGPALGYGAQPRARVG